MPTKKSILSCLLLIPFLFNSCIQTDNSKKFKVGAILPLTGFSSEYGEAAKNGIELAKLERPELFKNIDFTYEDSHYEGKTAITTFHRFRTSENIDLVFIWGHGPCEAVAPLAETHKVPSIVISGDYKVAKDREYVIRFFPIHELFGEKILQFIRSKGYKKIGIIKTELGYLNHVVDGIKRHLHTDEEVEILDNFQLEETNFQTTISKLKSRKYDTLGVLLAQNQLSLFYQQAKAQNFHSPTFGSHTFASKKAIAEAQGGMTGAVYPAIPVDSEFKERYLAKFNTDVQISFAANSYDFAILLGELFNKRAGKITNKQIIESLKSVSSQEGVEGKYHYLETTEAGNGFEFSINMREIQSDNSAKPVPSSVDK